MSRRALFARGLFAADSSDVRIADDLRKCFRILPDSNDSGGFFLAVLVKSSNDSSQDSGKASTGTAIRSPHVRALSDVRQHVSNNVSSNSSGSGSKGGPLLDSLRVKTSSGKHV